MGLGRRLRAAGAIKDGAALERLRRDDLDKTVQYG